MPRAALRAAIPRLLFINRYPAPAARSGGGAPLSTNPILPALPKSFFTTDGVCRHAGRPCRPRLAALGLRLWARLSACSPAMPAPFAPVAADDKCPPTAFAQIVLGHRVQLRGSAAARHICERAHLGRRCHGPLARAVLRCLAAVAMKPRALYPGFQTPAS